MIDIHSHLIPGVDDGSTDLDESRAALETLAEQGVRGVVTTPHLDGSATRQPGRLTDYFARIDPAWERLHTLADDSFWDLHLARGAEVMLDVPDTDFSDPRVRLAGTDFVLVEFPYLNIPPHSVEAIYRIRQKGWIPIIAHPERYAGIERSLSLFEEWKRVGALLQVNCGSLLGRYGRSAEATGWHLVERGWTDYLASDYHGRGRCAVRGCRETLLERGAKEQAQLLMRGNPERLLRGELPEPVAPLSRPDIRSALGRLLRRFRT